MSGFKIINAPASIAMMIATPVFAQAAIQEPGVYAFYHPNAISCIPAGPCQRATLPFLRSVIGHVPWL